MLTNQRVQRTAAWYFGTREEFIAEPKEIIARQLAMRAVDESLEIESAQTEEWRQSVEVLQESLDERIPMLREVLASPGCEAIKNVVLEFDFRRRGLRMDCLLLGDGVLFVVEFKRTKILRSDRDQVMNYAVNLLEFHKVTREWCLGKDAIVVPIVALTKGKAKTAVAWPGLAGLSWSALANKPLECGRENFRDAIRIGLLNRRSSAQVMLNDWINSSFTPSSSILDATLSLYGNHDVVAIHQHAAPKAAIEKSVKEIREHIGLALERGEYHIIFLSGAPGAGKTLVGLEIVMRGQYAKESVFVTGNAPLVDVLNKALEKSYRTLGQRSASWVATGYRRADAHLVSSAASFKVVKAHNFLGRRDHTHRQEDGRVMVFDEAQRTYEKGRVVLGNPLPDHEADLILSVQRKAFPDGGAVIVALVGHNQAINRGERGIVAWLEAAERSGWSFSIADETLSLAEFQGEGIWATHPRRKVLKNGHLRQSMRYYRNTVVEEWASAVLNGDASKASNFAVEMNLHKSHIWITRDLRAARKWAKHKSVGGHRSGLIASGQAKRLTAEGLFVDYKPDIAIWMLAPTTDIRSSNALEVVQNQYQVQGLELDYCIVCWDADLRREGLEWASYKLSGEDWKKDRLVDVAKNGYRVLLTRARKGMVIFVPHGDATGEDLTRKVDFYDDIWVFLKECGAVELQA